MLVALSIPTSSIGSSSPQAAPISSLGQRQCAKTYTRAQFHTAARSTFRHPVVPSSKRKTLHKIVVCQRRAVSLRIVRRSLRRYKAAHARRFYWRIQWARLPAYDRAWALNVTACESGGVASRHDPSGIHHGAFQFLLSTAYAAGFKTDPHLTSWHEQAVRAVRWSHVAGRSQWECSG